ncbi:MAG: hypothetical protein H0T48_05765 [Gemmatimonadaceae bacterium]|nr:hypothetical protein [Gemmatimonadaceae bacterium]
MPQPVHARIPLSLLEAIRRIDTPADEAETEYVQELRNKRLGLSDTVYEQIRRYSDAVKRGHQIPFAEASALGTLIGRRTDADALFESAGSIFAKDVYESISSPVRAVIRSVPGMLARPLAVRQLETIAVRYLGGTLHRTGGFLTLQIPESVTVAGAPRSGGCVFYESALRELLRLLVGSSAHVDHVQCSQSGAGKCEWRAEWRHLTPQRT